MTAMFRALGGSLASVLTVCTALALAACGGKSDSDDGNGNTASCDFGACGGDVLGTWDIVQFCPTLVSDGTPPECSAKMALGDASASGWLQFDGSEVTTSLDVRYTMTWQLDSECVSALTDQSASVDAAFCSALEQQYVSMGVAQSVSCPYANGACLCSFGFVVASGGTSSYQLSGTSILSADGDLVPYCVKGDELRLRDGNELASTAYVLQRR